ncbi:oligoendopeptidase F [Lactobacillus curvatus]|nr:oligoendopeptidase F [Latilactobacillus curvatus]MSE24272.1 oligoendopeptidase F [Latilactobacillus curvatus]
MSTQQLPTRDAVSEKLTWDLTTIFKNDAAFEAAFKKVKAQLPTLKALDRPFESASQLVATIEQSLATFRQLETVYVYASMKNDQDTTNAIYQGYQAQVDALAAEVSAAAAFLEPAILAIPEAQLMDWIANTPSLATYEHFIQTITDSRPHVLSGQEEALLAAAGDIFGAASQTFSVLDNSDLQFPKVTDENGQTLQLSDGVYSQLLQSTNKTVRQEAFEALYTTYDQFKNTFATTLATEIKGHNYLAQVHHYDSARQAALAPKAIPETVYTTLVDQVNRHLPLLHRYTELRKKQLNLSELHMFDLYTPLLGKPALTYTYEQAQVTAKEALAILGPDYAKQVAHIFDDRLIDVCENQGKRSGAYSGGAYDTDPFILLNWQNDLNNLYTLVHETGHSVHSAFTRQTQDYVYGDYPIFVAEIASTTNENLLTEYLLQTQSDPKVQAYLLNYYLDGFKGTVFRQTQFAEFEHAMHTAAANGQPLTAEFMSQQYAEINARYYGPAVVNDPQIALEWTRIPHFYMNYYVYQYATGFAAATTLANGISTKQPGALEHYLDYLKAGSSAYPIEIMQQAGVDMTSADYLERAFAVFEKRLAQLEALLTKLN